MEMMKALEHLFCEERLRAGTVHPAEGKPQGGLSTHLNT